MLNDNGNFDYIVKCKEIDVEVSDTLQKRFSAKNIRNLAIYLSILFIFFIIQIYDANKKILLPTIFFVIAVTVILKIIATEIKWKLRIKDKKIYVDYDLRHHIIEYSDLVNFELTKVYKRVTRYSSILIDALVITYMKNGKIKKIILETREYLKSEISEICKSFIKKSQLDVNANLYYDYFDIGGEDIDTKLKALEKYNNKKSIIMISYLLLMIILLLLFCYYIFKAIL